MERVNYFKTSPLLTDKYMISMCYMYFRTGKHLQNAVFEFFFRKNPFKGNFTVWAGLGQVVNWIKNLKFSDEDIEHIKTYLPKNENFTKWLKSTNPSMITIKSIQEGTVLFPKTPLITLEGPLGLIQLLEAPLLNMLNFPSLISTQAARYKHLANGRKVMEFGLRRAQGPNGALVGSLYAYLGGIDATSNVLAGKEFNVPVVGTMGHSYVTSFSGLKDIETVDTLVGEIDLFIETVKVRAELGYLNTHDGELASFIAFAVGFPDNLVCLVDTWDTVKSGFRNYVCVAVAMLRNGMKPKGLRLDSGDLVELAREIRENLDELQEMLQIPISENTLIIASDGINEKKIKEYPEDHCIDALAIGTNLITCQSQPALGMVCKLVELEGTPIIKLSSDIAKMTLPGKKLMFRVEGVLDGKLEKFDIIGTEDELIAPDDMFYINVYGCGNGYKETQVKVKNVEILTQISFEDGVIKKGSDFDTKAIRNQVQSQLEEFHYLIANKKLSYKTFISENLHKKLQKLISDNKLAASSIAN